MSFKPIVERLALELVDDEVSQESVICRSYYNNSIECAELFKAWEYQVANSCQSYHLLELIANVVTTSRLLGFRSLGTAIVRRCMLGMTVIYRNMTSGNQELSAGTLILLGAMVRHGANTTRELVSLFNFSLKSFPGFLNNRKVLKDSQESLRSLYIHFILGFFIRGDAAVKKTILDTKGLLLSLFKDITKDNFELVQFVLSTLQRALIDDISLPRSPKIAFFNNYLLGILLPLYSNFDEKNLKHCSKVDPKRTIASLIHSFFEHLCLNPGSGIAFSDHGWYPPVFSSETYTAEGSQTQKKVFNVVLLRFLPSLKISSNMEQRQLLLHILSKCPELVHQYTLI